MSYFSGPAVHCPRSFLSELSDSFANLIGGYLLKCYNFTRLLHCNYYCSSSPLHLLRAPRCHSAPTHSRLRWIVLGFVTVKHLLSVQCGVLCAIAMPFSSWMSLSWPRICWGICNDGEKLSETGLPLGGSSVQAGREEGSDPWNTQKKESTPKSVKNPFLHKHPARDPGALAVFCVWGERRLTLSLHINTKWVYRFNKSH